ncbi:MAG: glycosyltransferase [Methylomarinum sp.]|nr:glycosyltransferase [Methylomarinum sp.]
MKLAVVIPTHNRPDFLKETINSFIEEGETSEFDLDIVIVDDGSTPPVDIFTLQKEFKREFIFHRNEKSAGLAYARNKGVQLTNADIIIHLDDDDKLNNHAITEINNFFIDNPDIGVLLLGVKGFGSRKTHFENANKQGLNKILEMSPHQTTENNDIHFTSSLFPALLQTVPVCFQNYAVKKSTWNEITNLRLKSYFGDFDQAEIDQYTRLITGPLRDSEWIIYASLITKISLYHNPLYLVRCEGQGFVSKISMRDKQVEAQINTKKQLFSASKALASLKKYHKQIKESLEIIFFDNAYYQLHTQRNKSQARQFLLRAFVINQRLKHCTFFIKLLLPLRLIKSIND